jgi:hypothetical protein
MRNPTEALGAYGIAEDADTVTMGGSYLVANTGSG